MDDQGFWQLISRLDWKRTGNDALVIKPVVDALAEMDGTEIRAFQEILAKKLFALGRTRVGSRGRVNDLVGRARQALPGQLPVREVRGRCKRPSVL
jgi:hypothetical protein